MDNLLPRLVTVSTAALLSAACAVGPARPPAAAPGTDRADPPPLPRVTVRVEAEEGVARGVQAEPCADCSGGGLVRGFDRPEDRLELRPAVGAGLYELRIGYRAPHTKGFQLLVNEQTADGHLVRTTEGVAEHVAGKYLLPEGEQRIVIGTGWGHFDIDFIELRPADASPPARPSKELSDLQADRRTRALFSYLVDVYGEKTLSGQQGFEEIDYVRKMTGREPAVGAFDLMDYSPSRLERGAKPGDLVERIAAWAGRRAGIVMLSWHWNAPMNLIDQSGGKEWWRGFYTNATTFDLQAALNDTNSEEHRLLLRDLDAIAQQLRKLSDAGVPVLWRPLHEAEGGWFWWGARGPAAFVRLWQLMFDRYVNVHNLHHLIWVYSPPDRGIEAQDWYPGDEYVDVVAPDIYTEPGSSMSGPWEALQRLYGGRKLIALAETGSLPEPESARCCQVRWSWFNVWSGKFIRRVPAARLRSIYRDRDTVVRDQLPELPGYPVPSS